MERIVVGAVLRTVGDLVTLFRKKLSGLEPQRQG
jgi:hypothetical protein